LVYTTGADHVHCGKLAMARADSEVNSQGHLLLLQLHGDHNCRTA
jgi:hypothetical protein